MANDFTFKNFVKYNLMYSLLSLGALLLLAWMFRKKVAFGDLSASVSKPQENE